MSSAASDFVSRLKAIVDVKRPRCWWHRRRRHFDAAMRRASMVKYMLNAVLPSYDMRLHLVIWQYAPGKASSKK